MTSTDGTTFTAYTAGTSIPLAKVGDKVYFKGADVKTYDDKHFEMTGKIAASGDVTSLTNGTGGDATLTSECYRGMFWGSTSLTTEPQLPATTLAASCYCCMFQGCTKLSKVTVNFTDWNTSGYATSDWLDNAGTDASVTSRTFICPVGLTIPTTRSDSDVPDTWTVVKAVSTEADLNTAVSNVTAGEVIQLTGDIDLTSILEILNTTPAFTSTSMDMC